MEYVRVANTSELAPGQMKRAQLEGHDILLANVEGNFYAIGNRCTHRGGSLCQGSLVSVVVQCPRHGARFDVRTGRAVCGARVLFFEKEVKDAVCFQVLIDDSQVFVGLPDLPDRPESA
jgi:3-phenylpropionate/trans-cinnamate dioxygenase ferredoxin component